MNKTERRADWIKDHEAALRAAMTPLDGSTHNARHNYGMSEGGWGYWVRAFRQVECVDIATLMRYWSGSAPIPSTAINRGVADYIDKNAPEDLR